MIFPNHPKTMKQLNNETIEPKIAIVCDFLTKLGGAQKVLLSLHELYPAAPIYCLLYDEKGTGSVFKDCKIIRSSLQKQPGFLRHRPKFLIGKFAKAIEEFDLSKYDIVISSNDSFSHGVITKPETFHLCYCHTPARYLWDWHAEYLAENKLGFNFKGMFVRNLLHKQRIWDRVSADRVDHFLVNSENVKGRIKKYYQRDSDVVYPPVEVTDIKIAVEPPEDFYLIVSRLEPYKKIDLAIRACNKLKKKMMIVGEGSAKKYLQSIAGPTIKFVGWKNDKELWRYYRQTKSFIFPGEDDFGITPVEAMAAGRPVIAYGKGGATETILNGSTGLFFYQPTVESLTDAIGQLEKKYDNFIPANCRTQAEKFSKEKFLTEIKKQVELGYKKHLEMMNNV